MSLDKAVLNGKEYREKYQRAKAVDRTCRNHGSCEFCKHSRLHSNYVRRLIADEQLKEYMKEDGNGEGEESCCE
jgi:hypothetical protein